MSTTLPEWTPFVEASGPPPTDDQIKEAAITFGMTEREVKALWDEIRKDVTLVNSRYQVAIRRVPNRGWPDVLHLSIKRRDKERVGPERYRDFLRIKNELVGEDHEAFEIYPAMERNVDTANQYHLWVFTDPSIRIPVGFSEGLMISDSVVGAKQHPHEGT